MAVFRTLALLFGAIPALIAAGPENDYVDSAACARCHREIDASYRQTGMGRSK